ncbi:unnamed protein product, partial [Dibothriocephalus latus]
MNQLIELSRKSAPVGTQNAIVNLIQQLVDSEIECDTFCTQLSASLNRDAEPMNIGPFIKDNIALLRRELYNGVCTLPNIRPPSLDVEASQSQRLPSSLPQPIIAGVSTMSNSLSQPKYCHLGGVPVKRISALDDVFVLSSLRQPGGRNPDFYLSYVHPPYHGCCWSAFDTHVKFRSSRNQTDSPIQLYHTNASLYN